MSDRLQKAVAPLRDTLPYRVARPCVGVMNRGPERVQVRAAEDQWGASAAVAERGSMPARDHVKLLPRELFPGGSADNLWGPAVAAVVTPDDRAWPVRFVPGHWLQKVSMQTGSFE
jgi:hypothetical protein